MKQSIDDLPLPGEKVWFIIRPDSHEGPYDLAGLQDKLTAGELRPEASVWARGWPSAVTVAVVLAAYENVEQISEQVRLPQAEAKPIESEQREVSDAEPSPLEPSTFAQPAQSSHNSSRRFSYVLVVLTLVFGFWAARELREQNPLVRPAEMPLEAFRDMQATLKTVARPVPLPRAVVSADYRKIWLADGSTQQCEYQAHFQSAANENLASSPIAFQSEATSTQHWLVLERFSFTEGQRLIPGRYELKLTRRNCLVQGIASWWSRPDPALSVSFAVDLFHGSAAELTQRLEQVSRKREAELLQQKTLAQQAWRDVGEKLRTLAAIASQVQLGFQALLERKWAWPMRLQRVIDQYTSRHGSFLTNFTVKNDEDFAMLAAQELPQKAELMGKQPLINAHAKRIGFLSMTLIERLQKNKEPPNRRVLQDWLTALEQDFGVEKEKLRVAAEAAQAAAASL